MGEPVLRSGSRVSLSPDQSAAVAASPAFRALMRSRTRFVLIAAGFAFVFNVAQPVLSVFTTVLDGYAVGSLTWGWVYAFAQMLVPLIILQLYLARSRSLDAMSASIQHALGTGG